MTTSPVRVVEGFGSGRGVLAIPLRCDRDLHAASADVARAAALAMLAPDTAVDDAALAVDRATTPAGAPAPHVALAAVTGRAAVALRSFPPAARALDLPAEWRVVLVTPQIAWDEDAARRALTRAPHAGALQRARIASAGLAFGLARADEALVRLADDDRIVAHALGRILPGLHPVIDAARRHGAMLAGPDGVGPSVAALCASIDIATEVAAACVAAWRGHAIGSTAVVRAIGAQA